MQVGHLKKSVATFFFRIRFSLKKITRGFITCSSVSDGGTPARHSEIKRYSEILRDFDANLDLSLTCSYVDLFNLLKIKLAKG